MLAIVLALAAAIGYGGSDFAAGLASRHAGVIQVTLLASAVSAAVVWVALPLAAAAGPASRPPGAASLAWGAAGGLGGTLGALALYLGFRHAAFSVAGPISAVGAAGFSVLAGLLLGERPTALALTGIMLALPAIVGVSASAAAAGEGIAGAGVAGAGVAGAGVAGAGVAGETDAGAADEGGAGGGARGRPARGRPARGRPARGRPARGRPARGRPARGRPARGVVSGLIAGACFALLFIGLNRAGSGSGLWPVAATVTTELAVAVVVAAATRNFRLPPVRPGWLAVLTGAIGAAGTIMFFYATHDAFLAVTAVLTSLYPAVTIVLARTVLGERLTILRLAGLALAGACVALIAAGGAG